jgi:hypothetical protein
MLKKDLIVRQFEEFGKVLAQILTFKKNQDWQQFEKELSEAFNRFTQLELRATEELNLSEFENDVVYSNTLTPVQKKILARILFEKMEYYMVLNEIERSGMLQKKCYSLYSFLANQLTENEYDLDIHYKLDLLKKLQ